MRDGSLAAAGAGTLAVMETRVVTASRRILIAAPRGIARATKSRTAGRASPLAAARAPLRAASVQARWTDATRIPHNATAVTSTSVGNTKATSAVTAPRSRRGPALTDFTRTLSARTPSTRTSAAHPLLSDASSPQEPFAAIPPAGTRPVRTSSIRKSLRTYMPSSPLLMRSVPMPEPTRRTSQRTLLTTRRHADSPPQTRTATQTPTSDVRCLGRALPRTCAASDVRCLGRALPRTCAASDVRCLVNRHLVSAAS